MDNRPQPQPPSGPQNPPPYPGRPAEKKKGLGALGWVGIGCGGMLVVAVIGGAFLYGWGKRKFDEIQSHVSTSMSSGMSANSEKTAAGVVLELNPDLEQVSDDPGREEMTVRIVSSGEEITLSYSDLAAGRFTVKGADGVVKELGSDDLTVLPAWVPEYAMMEDARVPFHLDEAGALQGLLTFGTNESPDDVATFYDGEMGNASSRSSGSMHFGDVEQVTKSYSEGARELWLVIVRQGPTEKTRVQVKYVDGGP